MRKVTRTWTNKKTGETITREYTYKTGKSRKGYVLIDSKGHLRKKNIEKYKQIINANDSYTVAEKRMLIVDLEDYINVRKGEKRKLTTRGFEGHLQENEIERMFANAGMSSSEVAQDMGIDEADILNPENWENGLLVINGVKYAFNHNYTGDALEVVKE